MNAVIALCHFCELHGPRILFSTQAYHNDPGKLGASATDLFRNRTGTEGSTSSAGSERSGGATSSQRTELCEACRSIQHGHSGFISHDHDVGISYTSTQSPSHPQIFIMVRQACIRSLSCEVCPGREGPIFFGDEHYGYTLSYTFFVKDSQARGFQRWYSIIVVMMDRMFLLNSWPFLTSNIRSIIDKIQAQAISIYEKEQAAKSERAERINRQLHAPQTFYLRRGGGAQAFRSLIDLTGDKQLFRYLHMLFAWILMAGGSRLTEKVLEGPPNEEAFLDFAREEETEEGFIKVTTRYLDAEKVQTDEASSSPSVEVDTSYSDDGGFTFRSLSHFRKVIGSINFHDLAYHVLTGNQVIVRSQSKTTLKSVFDVLKTLLPAGIGTTIVFSDKYEESWKCNFLGLSLDTGIPEYVIASELYIALDIIPMERNLTKVLVESSDPFHGHSIAIKSSAIVPDKVPTFQSRVEHMMDNTSLDENVISTFLTAIKQEWMNKVKMLFKFTRAGNHTEEETNRLLKILQAEKQDEPLLKYWKVGLSSQYKSHLLTESMGLASPSSS